MNLQKTTYLVLPLILLIFLCSTCGVYESRKDISTEFRYNGFHCDKKLLLFQDSVKSEMYTLIKNNRVYTVNTFQTSIKPENESFYLLLNPFIYERKTEKLYENYGFTGDFKKLQKAKKICIETDEPLQISRLSFDTSIVMLKLNSSPYNFYLSDKSEDLVLSKGETINGQLFFLKINNNSILLSLHTFNIEDRKEGLAKEKEILEIINLVKVNIEI